MGNSLPVEVLSSNSEEQTGIAPNSQGVSTDVITRGITSLSVKREQVLAAMAEGDNLRNKTGNAQQQSSSGAGPSNQPRGTVPVRTTGANPPSSVGQVTSAPQAMVVDTSTQPNTVTVPSTTAASPPDDNTGPGPSTTPNLALPASMGPSLVPSTSGTTVPVTQGIILMSGVVNASNPISTAVAGYSSVINRPLEPREELPGDGRIGRRGWGAANRWFIPEFYVVAEQFRDAWFNPTLDMASIFADRLHPEELNSVDFGWFLETRPTEVYWDYQDIYVGLALEYLERLRKLSPRPDIFRFYASSGLSSRFRDRGRDRGRTNRHTRRSSQGDRGLSPVVSRALPVAAALPIANHVISREGAGSSSPKIQADLVAYLERQGIRDIPSFSAMQHQLASSTARNNANQDPRSDGAGPSSQ